MCACEIIQLFYVVSYMVSGVHKFGTTLAVNETPNKSDQWKGHDVTGTHVVDSEETQATLCKSTAFSCVRDGS